MDIDSKNCSAIPTTVLDYAAAVQHVAGGQFTNRFSEDGQRAFASYYGAAFFALSKFAPEALDALGSNLLLIAADPAIADDGGRWLSLYAKVHKPAQKFSLTVCVPGKPRTGKAPKPLLFQPPQQVLLKEWRKHLQALDKPPDVLIYQPPSLKDLEAALEIFSRYAPGKKLLVPCNCLPDVLVARSLLRSRGFEAGAVIGFRASESEEQHHATGAWWFSSTVPSLGELKAHNKEFFDGLRMAQRAFFGHLGSLRDRATSNAVAAIYATRETLKVENDVVRSIRTSPDEGICLSTGRFFTKSIASGDAEFNWEDAPALGADVLALVPDEDAARPADEDRLELMRWLGMVVQKDSRDTSAPITQYGSGNVNAPQASQSSNSSSLEDSRKSDEPSGLVPESKEKKEVANPHSSSEMPARPRLSRSAGTVNVLAFAAMLGRPGANSVTSFGNAKKDVLQWLSNKGFKALDPVSSQHAEHAEGEVTIETDGQGIWAMRFDDRSSMANGAIWRVEVTLLGVGASAISVRMAQVRSTVEAPPPVASGVPSVVSKVAQHIGLQDAGVVLADSAMRLKGADDEGWFNNLLLNPHRGQPVIVIAGNVDGSADRLAKRLVGVAHVLQVDKAITDGLIRNFGRDLSVFGNAVRLYRPGFSTHADPFQHPLWVLKGPTLPKWLADELFEHACSISLEIGDLEERAPSFHAIRNMLAEGRLASSEQRLVELRREAESIASTADESIGRLRAINEELEASLAEQKARNKYLVEQLTQVDQELQATKLERTGALEEVRQLRFKLNTQWNDIETGYSDIEEEVEYPDSWDDLETWVEVYGQEKLVLHPKAAKAARESPFKDIPLAYKAMDYLVRYYIPMRTRSSDDTDAYQRSKQALSELGLEESDVGTADEIKRYKKEYKRLYDGREVTLDRHLKRGVGFGGDFQFRMYFYYDDVAQKVLVGHMPTHLTNRLSHNG